MCEKTVQVALRVRPLVLSEITKGCKDILETYPELNQVRIKDTDRAFTYNYIFDTESTQDTIYDQCVKNLVQNIFKGYNVTVLAYGQTGSGKTHTMGTTYDGEGPMGVIPRSVTEIFEHLEHDPSLDFSVAVSFMELYQETLYDLLSTKSREQCVLEIREDASKGVVVPGLTQVPVHTVERVFEELARGSRSRATSATNMNAQSSRSHAIFTVAVAIVNKNSGEEISAKFHLVDLAGSERPKKTGAVGTTFKEGVNINKGLLVLGNVISALGDENKSQGHIPYRDSNLTRLLKDSLGGNSVTLMVACVSPADYNTEETLSTLRYADRAKRIRNKPIVNMDPRMAEINLLKKTVRDLRLQIVGQGGPVNCEEISQIKEENKRLHSRIRDLTSKLSSTLNDNTGLLEKIMIIQSANESLHKKIQELKMEYELTLDHINTSCDQNNKEGIMKGLEKLQQIQEQFYVIDLEQKNTETEILNHEQLIDLQSQNDHNKEDCDISKESEHFTNQQLALKNELQEITKKLALKEHLARQISTNAQHLVDYTAMAENEDKILQLQREKDELLQQLKNVQGCKSNGTDQRKKRVQELETQIQDLNKKVQEQARLIKLKEKDVGKMNKLHHEILQMKQAKVKLIRKMREEAEQFKTWKVQRERELAKLKQQDRKKQNQIVKMEVMHSKQQNVLKRKVEEAVALNKRLKEALALRKTAQETKNLNKTDRIGHWIKHELDIQMHLIEAEATLSGLMEDRATLQVQLNNLRKNDAEPDHIKSIEDDIELRSVQIQDLQQKLLDSEDGENKKSKFDNIQTMGDAKYAVKILNEQIVEIKKNEVKARNKLLESQACAADLRQRFENVETCMKLMEYKQAEEFSNLQKDYEEKIAVLLRQLRGVEVKNGDEELRKRCAIEAEKNEALDLANQDLLARLVESQEQIKELSEKLETITEMAQNGHEEDTHNFVTPTPKPKKRPIKIKRELDSTFSIENQENLEIDVDVDDVERDPDWRMTPLGKWVIERKRKTQAKMGSGDENTTVNGTFKRTSEGGCTCVKSNCTARCGCRKTSRMCSSQCKCSDNCTNKDLKQDSEDSIELTDEKKPRMTKQILFPFN